MNRRRALIRWVRRPGRRGEENDRQGGDDPEFKKWAAKTLPNLERYLTMAEKLKYASDPNEKWRRGFELPVIARGKKCGRRPVMRQAGAAGGYGIRLLLSRFNELMLHTRLYPRIAPRRACPTRHFKEKSPACGSGARKSTSRYPVWSQGLSPDGVRGWVGRDRVKRREFITLLGGAAAVASIQKA
jgi:hypothetical protein